MKKIFLTALILIIPSLALIAFFRPAASSVGQNTAPDVKAGGSAAAPGKYYVIVEPDAYFKVQGGSVSFEGSHFYPNEIVAVKRGGARIAAIQADGRGSFISNPFTVSNSRGKETYVFTGTTSGLSFPVTISVGGSYPWLKLSNYYSGAGSSIAIEGHGFGSYEPVTVWFAGLNVGTVGTTRSGDFVLSTVVPDGGAGKKTIQAVGVNTEGTIKTAFSQAY